MGRDELRVGVRIRKILIISTKMFYRSVKNHPFFVGIILLLLFLYRSSPFLFSMLVSASPVLVCTAVLLGTLLSLGDSNISLLEEDERISPEISQLKMGTFENPSVVAKDESSSKDKFTDLRRDIVGRNLDKEPLLDSTDITGISEMNDDVNTDSMLHDENLRQISFENEKVDERFIGFESLDIEQKMITDDRNSLVGNEVGSSDDVDNRISGSQSENFEDYRSAEGSVDTQISEELESSMGSWKRFDDVFEDKLSPVLKVQAAVHAQIRNQLESSFRSWKQLDEAVGDRSSSSQKDKMENFEDYKSADDSMDMRIRDQLESSLRSWKQLDSDHEGDDESDSGSDGAESSSPDASLADIIPMLDELHPLLEDENPQALGPSRGMEAKSEKSHEGSIHSDNESAEKEGDEEVRDIKSDADDDDDDDEEETQGNNDSAKSPITWTEDDQKNLMDLGTSELERNQRLESLIARRRARRNLGLLGERNLIDFDGMDLQFPVPQISTSRRNPFDFPNDSYDDLGLPPIPGSAPSVLVPRRNPFDLPYDSSEEKPDLMGDSFQEEFMELNQREASYQKEPVFRRNETFTMGSFIFDLGRYESRTRASRFRPYFVPERTDSDTMSYSSFQRQLSELSESKLSSAAETESISAVDDEEQRRPVEKELTQEMEPSSEIDHASLYVEHGSESSDVHSLSDKEDEHEDAILHEPEIEMGRAENSLAAASYKSENYPPAESCMSGMEVNTGNLDLMTESTKEHDVTSSSSSSSSEKCDNIEVEDEDKELTSEEQSQVNYVESADVVVENPRQVSTFTFSNDDLQTSEISHSTDLDDGHPKEPVYDLSPQAVKNNNSSSSISSHLLMDMSEINPYHLSNVQRELFMNEQSKDHEEDGEENTLDRKEDIDGNGFLVKQNVEDNEHDICEFQFPVSTQHPVTLEASMVSEYEVDLSADSLKKGLVEDASFDNKVSLDEGRLDLNQEDAGVYIEGKLETVRNEDDVASAAEFNHSQGILIGLDKKDIITMADSVPPVQSKLSYEEVEQKDQNSLHNEADHHLRSSNSDLADENIVDEILVSPLDEAHHSPHDSAIHEHSDESEKQGQSVTYRKFEEVVELDSLDETVNTVVIQEPPDFEQEQIAESVDKDHAHYNIYEDRGAPESDGKIFSDLTDMKDMDDDLLSELDAVGDFSVKDTGPSLNADMLYSNVELDLGLGQRKLDDSCSSLGISSPHDTLLEGGEFAANSEDLREVTQPIVFKCEEPSVDLSTVEDIDAALKKMSEGETPKSVTVESAGAELRTGQVEASYQETELFREVPEHGVDSSEEVSLSDASLVNKESVSESTASDRISMAADADEDSDKAVETETKMFSHVEPLSAADKSGLGSVESTSLSINKNINIHELSSVEESIIPAFESSTQVVRVGSLESVSLQTDAEIKEIENLPIVQRSIDPSVESEHQTKTHDFPGSESLNIYGEAKEIQQSPTVDMAPAADSDNQRLAFFKPESSMIAKDNKEVQDLPVSETSIACSVDSEDQTLIPCSMKPLINRDIEDVQQLPVVDEASIDLVESESLLTVRDSEEVQEASIVDANDVPIVKFEDQKEKEGSLNSNNLQMDGEIKDLQEPSVEAGIESSVGLIAQIEDTHHVEVIKDQDVQKNRFPSEQLDHTSENSMTTESTGSGSFKEISENDVVKLSSQIEDKEGKSNESH